MASAEHLLHEAQYAFHSISFGQTPENTRNASRARSLCRKILRKYPASMEAGEATAILQRLGDEAYDSKLQQQHRHVPEETHHQRPGSAHERQAFSSAGTGTDALDWAGLIGLLVRAPRYILGLAAFAGFFLFGLFGPFIFLPLVAIVLLTGPFRQMLKPDQRREMDGFIVRVNEFIAKQGSRNS